MRRWRCRRTAAATEQAADKRIQRTSQWCGDRGLDLHADQISDDGVRKIVKIQLACLHKIDQSIFHVFELVFCIDFLNSEFQIITNRVHDSKKQHDDYILKILDPNTKTLDKLAQINIALFAGFESSALKSFDKISFLDDLKQEVIDLEKRAQNQLKSHSWYNNMNIFILFFPLDNKREFVSELHQKLKGAQQI